MEILTANQARELVKKSFESENNDENIKPFLNYISNRIVEHINTHRDNYKYSMYIP